MKIITTPCLSALWSWLACLRRLRAPALSTLATLAVLMMASLLALQTPVHAAPLTPADEKSVRSVVEAQLAALAKDDAVKAFSYAAPNVRRAFGTASRFLSMVQNDYPVVYRPASVVFLKPLRSEGDGDDVVQRVQMQDAGGTAWLATYSLQRQKAGVWRITGCTVVENKGRMA